MKILITTDLYKAKTNGVSVSVRNLASEMEKHGHDVRILTLSNDKKSYVEDSVYYIGSFALEKIYPNVRGTVRFHDRLILELIAWNPDVIHSQCEFFTFSFAKQISKKTGAPIVHTYHTLYEQYSQYVISNQKFGSFIVCRLVKWRLRDASAIIVPTGKVEAVLIGYRIDKPIFVVPTGLDIERYSVRISAEQRTQMRAQYGITEADFVMIYLGRFGAEKSIGELLTLLSDTGINDKHMKLMLVGDGPEMENLKSETNHLGVQDHVIFTGMVAPDAVSEYYQMADVFVSASTSETQGLTYVEAAANGLPLVCKANTCLAGILKPGVNGFSFTTPKEFIAAISRLKDDPMFRAYAARCSIGIAKKFDRQAFGKSAEQVYAAARKMCCAHGCYEVQHDYFTQI